ncbi:helix-turn-helix domain-containing protein [Synechococcus sp. CC9605]|uniref:helix-turn-helix domain-containing protein n=1 Tax=Synechococcus sp. (strain CC9605) TaxID=110662 RepID=UPI00005D5BB2|nr:helix-turn-helix domain-containing protein [Synechococcus sp. CC9605]ABB35421.1 hypothetical protein Syncc9605_1672 [Synechococcus sp. CC9605]
MSVCLSCVWLTDNHQTTVLTVQELAARYGITRQSVYERLKAAGITPVKRGNRSLFDKEMVACLDEQHRKLQQGSSLRDATDDRQTIDITPVRQPTLEPAPDQGLALLVSALSSALQPTDDAHLTTHRQLQEIADKGWVVPTRVLARVLGQSNSSLHSWGEKTERLGFTIERTGSRGMFRVSQS